MHHTVNEEASEAEILHLLLHRLCSGGVLRGLAGVRRLVLDAALFTVVVEEEAGGEALRQSGTAFIRDQIVVVRALELDVPVLSPDSRGVSHLTECCWCDGGGLLGGVRLGCSCGRVLGGGGCNAHRLLESKGVEGGVLSEGECRKTTRTNSTAKS